MPAPFRGALGAGDGVVLALTLEQVREAIGEQACRVFELVEVRDGGGDDFALGMYAGAGNALRIKTITGQEYDWGELGASFDLELAESQFHLAELTAPCTITIVPAAAAPLGVGRFDLRLKGTAANAVTWTNLEFSGTGPDLTEADEWIITIRPNSEGIFQASALPF